MGTNFGVDTEGKLYATGANISGTITATEGNFSDSVTIGGTTVTAGYLKDLYNYAIGGTGTTITQVEAKKGSIGGWKIAQNYLCGEGNDGGWKIYLYPDGRNYYTAENAQNTFFFMIYAGTTPYAGISTSGWQYIYNE